MDERMNVRMYVRMYVRMITYVCTYVRLYVCIFKKNTYVCVILYNYIGLCINVHMQSYVYIDIYIYNKIHIHIYTQQIRHTAMEDGIVPFRFRPTRHPVEAQYSISDIPISRRVAPNVYALSPQLPSESTPHLGTPILCLMDPHGASVAFRLLINREAVGSCQSLRITQMPPAPDQTQK